MRRAAAAGAVRAAATWERRSGDRVIGEKFTVESRSSNPYFGGWIEVQVLDSVVRVRWEGETEWHDLEWHELMYFAGLETPQLRDDLDCVREQAYDEGLTWGVERGRQVYNNRLRRTPPRGQRWREPMHISVQGRDMLRKFEGCKLTAYLDAAGVLTIGYGCTGPHIFAGQTITEPQAESLLSDRIAHVEMGLAQLVKRVLAQHQWDALVLFSYNVGLGQLGKSTMLKLLNQGDMAGAAAEFGKWVYVTVRGEKHKLDWQEHRRSAEADLFLHAKYGDTAKTEGVTAPVTPLGDPLTARD